MIRITGLDNTVIYEGEGEIHMGFDPSGPSRGAALLRIERGGRYLQADFTEMLRTTRHSWRRHLERPPMEAVWAQAEEPLRIPDPPRVVLTELDIEIPAGAALALREHIEREAPSAPPPISPGDFTAQWRRERHSRQEYYRSLAEMEMTLDFPVPEEGRERWREFLRAVGEQRVTRQQIMDAYGFAGPEDEQLLFGDLDLEQARTEQDELIRSTRAEFPYDPLGYGERLSDQMRWSPPADDKEVRPCP